MATSTTPKRTESLCDVCSALDLESYFQRATHSRLDRAGRPGATPDATKLGTFEHVYAKSSTCRFCDLVVCGICNFRSWDMGVPRDIIARARARGDTMELWLYSYRFGFDVFKGSRREALRIGIARRTGLETRQVEGDHVGDIQLFCGDAIRVTGRSLFHGRMVSMNRLDVRLPEFWLECCEKIIWGSVNLSRTLGWGRVQQW